VWAASIIKHRRGHLEKAAASSASRRIVPREGAINELRSYADPVEEALGHVRVLIVQGAQKWKRGNNAVHCCHVGAGPTCARPIARARGRRERTVAVPTCAPLTSVERRLLRAGLVCVSKAVYASKRVSASRKLRQTAALPFVYSWSGPPARARARQSRLHPIARNVNYAGCTPGRHRTQGPSNDIVT